MTITECLLRPRTLVFLRQPHIFSGTPHILRCPHRVMCCRGKGCTYFTAEHTEMKSPVLGTAHRPSSSPGGCCHGGFSTGGCGRAPGSPARARAGPNTGPPRWGDSNHIDPRWSQGMPERQWESGQSSVRVPAPYAGAE